MKAIKILSKLSKRDIVFLAQLYGLELTHYNTKKKQVAGLVVCFYRNRGLSDKERIELNKVFN